MAAAGLMLSYFVISMVSACVPPSCVYVTHRPEDVWGKSRHVIASVCLSVCLSVVCDII